MFDKEKVFLGITPTVWTNDDLPTLGDHIPFEQCVSEMALAGFQGCSVGHKFPRDTNVLKEALDLRGLRVSEPWASTYFSVEGMEKRTHDSFREQMNFIKEMGGTDIVVAELGHAVHQQPISLLPNKPVMDDDQWKKVTAGLDELGKIAVEGGMRLMYHHHMGTVVQNRDEVDRLMEMTDPRYVNLLLDTGHLHWAGDDPLQLAKDHTDRIKHVHLKDIRDEITAKAKENEWSFLESVVEGAFTVPGDGVIDFRPILQVLSEAGYEGWLVVEEEQA
ncbi:MAG: myo-inosose-2 dehydratase, partial [Thermoanaerobaculia bacterium]|nr:myo-inosose-2 dehydratase [Thermoanaerobaculia bacterium]